MSALTQRVVVTGMGGLSPLGNSLKEAGQTLQARRSCIQAFPEWEAIDGLRTRLGAPVTNFTRPEHWNRKKVRTMGRVAMLATRATELALDDAGLLDSIAELNAGIAYGSTSGSPPYIQNYARQITVNKTLAKVSPSDYVKFMSHTTLSNIHAFFNLKGRMIPTSSACTSGSQAIGFAYETIKYGKSDIMLAGGSEELHVLAATVFDIMYATSTRNEAPTTTPRPFDVDRDGLVVGEGAGTLVLESLEHARKRGARIHAEIVGFGTNCDGAHIVSPSAQGMREVMELALGDARLATDQIGYINAHGTATEVGDIAETTATRELFDREVPISSLKSYMGHTLGACGALEAWLCIHMMNEGWFAPTINLDQVDPRCAPLGYLREVHPFATDYVMSNNFAFGGVNTSLVFGRWKG